MEDCFIKKARIKKGRTRGVKKKYIHLLDHENLPIFEHAKLRIHQKNIAPAQRTAQFAVRLEFFGCFWILCQKPTNLGKRR